jgi:hypothetical protein
MLHRTFAVAAAILVAHSSGAYAQGGVNHYCMSGPAGSHISVSGSSSFTVNGGSGDLVLHADNIGANAPGLFFMGTTAIAPMPFGNGFRCAGGTLVRLAVVQPDGTSMRSFALDYLSPGPIGMITPGSTRYFQFWFRSAGSFDLSDAVQIDFIPPSPLTTWSVIAEGSQSQHPIATSPGAVIPINNAADWATFWSEHAGGSPPAVDFTTRSVVAVFAGFRLTGGYSIDVGKLRLSVATLDLDTTESAPGPNCIVTLAATSPFQIISIQRIEHLQVGNWSQAVTVVHCP